MTLLISWIGADQKGHNKSVASLYFASDSRYSWGATAKFDYGIKVFGSTNQPEIFGICGDILFPSIILGQLIPQIDANILFDETSSAQTKNEKIFNYISNSLSTYPIEFMGETFTILHGTRIEKIFHLFKTEFSKKIGLSNEEIILPADSVKVFSGGSGAREFDTNWAKWNSEKHNDYRTSRAVYHCLTESIEKMGDPNTGGLPQIIGLYRIENRRLFGVLKKGEKFIYGNKSSESINSERIEWRNENFERINPVTLDLIEGAQRQPHS